MADSFTPNLNLDQPEVGSSTDTWGTKIVANYSLIDGLFAPGGKLLLSSGGTGASDAATARTNLGCGSMAPQNANAVAITGGTASGITVTGSSIDSTPIGASVANSVRATSVQL